MNQQKKQLLILVVLTLVTTAVVMFIFFGFRSTQEDEPSDKTELIFEASEGFTSIEVNGKDSYKIVCDDAGSWYLEEKDAKTTPDSLIPANRVQKMTELLSRISTPQVINGVSDFALYGLDQPRLTIRAYTRDNRTVLIEIGSFSEAASMYYARKDGSDTVFLLTTLIEVNFNLTKENLLKE